MAKEAQCFQNIEMVNDDNEEDKTIFDGYTFCLFCYPYTKIPMFLQKKKIVNFFPTKFNFSSVSLQLNLH